MINFFIIIILIILYVLLFVTNLDFTLIQIKKGTCIPVIVDKCFVISVPGSTKRLSSFTNSYTLNIPLEIIPGVDTKLPENSEKYKNLVDPEKYNLMYEFDKGALIRPNHTYFNSGALGCYLGHMAFYETCFNQGLKYAIVFEDNVILESSFNEDLNTALTNLGNDFDVCFFHCANNISEDIIKCGTKIKKLKFISSTKCYLINVDNMKKYYDLFYPINNHVDMIYEKLIYFGANIYLIRLKSISILKTKSTISHTLVKNNTHFQYLERGNENNIKWCS